jgi:hypothetical protein
MVILLSTLGVRATTTGDEPLKQLDTWKGLAAFPVKQRPWITEMKKYDWNFDMEPCVQAEDKIRQAIVTYRSSINGSAFPAGFEANGKAFLRSAEEDLNEKTMQKIFDDVPTETVIDPTDQDCNAVTNTVWGSNLCADFARNAQILADGTVISLANRAVIPTSIVALGQEILLQLDHKQMLATWIQQIQVGQAPQTLVEKATVNCKLQNTCEHGQLYKMGAHMTIAKVKKATGGGHKGLRLTVQVPCVDPDKKMVKYSLKAYPYSTPQGPKQLQIPEDLTFWATPNGDVQPSHGHIVQGHLDNLTIVANEIPASAEVQLDQTDEMMIIAAGTPTQVNISCPGKNHTGQITGVRYLDATQACDVYLPKQDFHAAVIPQLAEKMGIRAVPTGQLINALLMAGHDPTPANLNRAWENVNSQIKAYLNNEYPWLKGWETTTTQIGKHLNEQYPWYLTGGISFMLVGVTITCLMCYFKIQGHRPVYVHRSAV